MDNYRKKRLKKKGIEHTSRAHMGYLWPWSVRSHMYTIGYTCLKRSEIWDISHAVWPCGQFHFRVIYALLSIGHWHGNVCSQKQYSGTLVTHVWGTFDLVVSRSLWDHSVHFSKLVLLVMLLKC